MRRWLSFDVAGSRCAATLDTADGADGAHGLLIVSGGNEVRSGAHRGMAALAATLAAAGHPVMRFDRRGIGDSEGSNGGFLSSGPDIAAALTLLRETCPALTKITAFGNCDAATALLLYHQGAGIDALVLANPWTIDGTADLEEAGDLAPFLPPAAAIRARYIAKLKDPGEWLRLLGGGVNISKVLRGLRAAGASVPSLLGQHVADGIAGFAGPVTILIAQRDGTAQAFMAEWQRAGFAPARKLAELRPFDTASHSFADDQARVWLDQQLLAALA